jgi:hypothetical protein
MHVPAFYASSVQLRTRLDTRYIRILSHELALTKACGTTLRHQRHQTCAECSNTHVGVLKQTTKELSIVANRPPINISAECSTTPKWRSVIVQSACRHACFGVLRLVSAAWYTSRYSIHSYLYRMNLLSPRHAVQHDGTNAPRHAQSVMGTPTAFQSRKRGSWPRWRTSSGRVY